MTISPPPTDEARALARQVIDTWGDGNPPIVVLARALLATPPPPQSGWREAIEAAARVADSWGSYATARDIAERIRALPLPPVGTEEE